MNIGLITARIIEEPIRFSNFNHYFTEIQINFPHMKNYVAIATALADGEVAKSIEKFYCKGDYILIEGESLIIKNKEKNDSLIIYIIDVQPAHLIIKS